MSTGRLVPATLLLIASGPLLAEEGGDWLQMDLELGAGYQSDSLDAFGRSDHLSGQGWRGIGGLWLDWRSDAGDPEPVFFHLEAERGGPGATHLNMDYRRQGAHRTRLDFRELPRRLGDGRTPFSGAGSAELLLPDDWIAGPSTGDMPGLDGELQSAAYAHVRRELELAHERSLAMRWQLSSDFRLEQREGSRPVAAVMGSTGGNARSALVPAPVHYETREAELGLRYQRGAFHAEASYFLSLFDNRQSVMHWDNPYAGVAGWAGPVSHPEGRGHLSLPPDNQSQQLRLGLGHGFSPTLRGSADLVIGRSEQDERLLPYTVNESLSVEQGLPRDSAQARIDLLRLGGRLNWRPMQQLRVDLRYRHEDRDNRTPVDVFNYVPGDAVNQNSGLAHNRARLNMPVSYSEDRLDLDTAWRLTDGGQWFGGYRHERIRRDFSEVGRTEEDRLHAGFRRGLGESHQLALRVEQGWRRADDYDPTAPYFLSRSPEYVETVQEDLRFDNHPLLRRYNLADRDQRLMNLRWDWSASDRLHLGSNLSRSREDYRDSPLGLDQGRSHGVAMDMGWQLATAWSLDAFASLDEWRAAQNSRSFRGAAFKGPDSQDPDRDWRVETEDRFSSLGSGLNWSPEEAGYSLRLEWVEARSRSEFDLSSGPALALEPLPVIHTRGRTLSVSGEHELNPNVSLRWEWYRDYFRSNDWAWQDVDPDTMATVIGSGQAFGNERLDWYGLSLRWVFRP